MTDKKKQNSENSQAAADKKKRKPLSNAAYVLLYLLGFGLVMSLFLYWQKDVFFPGAGPKAPRVTVVLASNSSYDSTVMRQGMNQAAYDYNVELTFTAPIRSGDSNEQISLLHSERLDIPEGVIIVSVDSIAVVNYLTETPLDTKLLLINTPDRDGIPYAVVGSDYPALAEELIRKITQEAPAARSFGIYYTDGKDSAARMLEKTLLEALKASDHEVYSYALTPGISAEQLAAMVQGKDDVLIGLDGNALRLLAESSRYLPETDKPLIYGRGVSPENVDSIKSGTIRLLMAESDYNTGYLAVAEMALAIENKRTPESKVIAYTPIDRENVFSRENELLLFPIVG